MTEDMDYCGYYGVPSKTKLSFYKIYLGEKPPLLHRLISSWVMQWTWVDC